VIVETMNEAALTVSLKGTILFCNRRFCELMELPLERIIGQETSDFAMSGEKEKLMAQIAHAEDRPIQRLALVAADGKIVPVQVSASPLVSDGESSVCLVVSDLTELEASANSVSVLRENQQVLQQGQMALQRFNEELEQRVKQRTAEVVESQKRLRLLASELTLAEQRERQRLASELHDYLAQLLALGKMKLIQIRPQDMASTEAQVFKGLQQIMEEALTYTRTLMAQLSPPTQDGFSLPMALRWLAEQMQLQGFIVSLEVEWDALALPEDQARLLYQSARELIINVMKHGQTNQARVTLTGSAGILRLSVMDQGAGFEVDKVVGGVTMDRAGRISHFGLFSIRERMKALSGDFELHSRPGAGTQATLVLPIAAREPNDELGGKSEELSKAGIAAIRSDGSTLHSSRHSFGPTATIRILLVDDHAMVRQGLRSILEAYHDISVVGEAADGEEAVEQTRLLTPDVIVMDVNMPKMDGIEAIRRIKIQHPETLMLGLSLSPSSQVEPRVLEAGVSGFVSKDEAADRLYEAIIAMVRRET
jgi:PAS domain S-box-containing protein